MKFTLPDIYRTTGCSFCVYDKRTIGLLMGMESGQSKYKDTVTHLLGRRTKDIVSVSRQKYREINSHDRRLSFGIMILDFWICVIKEGMEI